MIDELPFKSSLLELGKIIDGVVKAGEKVLEVYETDFSTEKKDDDSPITQADIESNKILKEILGQTGITILSEEDTDDKKRLSEEKVWIIDPLDGTTDFVNRTGEFTIMVGLVEKQKSILGLIYWPIKKKMYLAESGKGAFCYNKEWEKIETTMMSEMQNCHALVSRHHLSEKEKRLLDEMEISVVTSIGSSLKVTEIASGNAEIYLTTTNKMKQWDTCASNCIISEAGGKMTDLSGKEFSYNTETVFHENGILVTNGLIHEDALYAISKLDS
ncbi:3'(2'),5'-bisphosphate nucleotidase CysQ [Candidatus Nitrosopelagicus sp.]|nr:3'(2'),5'-bisphosphate nucleotidase CysQ [Candidatus Nitrosopelagicus sp.]